MAFCMGCGKQIEEGRTVLYDMIQLAIIALVKRDDFVYPSGQCGCSVTGFRHHRGDRHVRTGQNLRGEGTSRPVCSLVDRTDHFASVFTGKQLREARAFLCFSVDLGYRFFVDAIIM